MIKHKRILLVEDDEDDYVLTSDYLQQLDFYSFEIEWQSTANGALEKLLQSDFDICLMDYQLGARSGLEVLKSAVDQGCQTPIIMLTGQTDESLDKLALDAGAVDYLDKGEISTPRFFRAIRYALARHDIAKERIDRLKAETQNKAKDRFLAHLSHELRTPLTSILGYTELLLSSEKSSRATSELNIILSNGKHLLSLLNDVLDLSKIAADKLELHTTAIDLDSFIADVFFLLRMNAQDKGLELKINALSPLPLTIFADATRLRQVLINLAYNAIKFTHDGEVNISFWMESKEGKELLYCKVADSGMGIPQDKLQSIFQPFEQIEDIISRKETGAGLGLAICNELVSRMGGELTVESEVNIGSQFVFSIDPGDISKLQRETLTFKKMSSSREELNYPALLGRVLVVDDVVDIRWLIAQTCRAFGLQVETANDGMQALQKCQEATDLQRPFDLILMDIHMPVLDGRKAIVKMRQQGYVRPVLALTAAALKGVQESLVEIGFSDVLPKPINKNILHSNLAKYLSFNPAPVLSDTEYARFADMTSLERHYLLVEDDHDAANITQLLLDTLGVKVVIASTAAACLALINSETSWDKILLDLHLPDINGLELARQIRLILPTVEIVIVSGTDVRMEDVASLGVTHTLLKPINMEKLKSLVSSS